MITINLSDMSRELPEYLDRINAGETVLVMHEAQPIAELKAVSRPTNQLRPFALCAGDFAVPLDFDAPLPEAVLADFEDA